MRNCVYCGPKEDSEFNKRGSRFQSVCRICQNRVSKQHYQDNKADYVKRKTERQVVIRNFLINYKTGKSCTDCGIIYPHYVLEFDHLRDKVFELAYAVARGYSLDVIRNEIAKCELVCANCHKTRTFNRKHTPGSFNG